MHGCGLSLQMSHVVQSLCVVPPGLSVCLLITTAILHKLHYSGVTSMSSIFEGRTNFSKLSDILHFEICKFRAARLCKIFIEE